MDVAEKALRNSRDPVEWAILADMLEERGEADSVVLYWRRMSAWGAILWPVWAEMSHRSTTKATSMPVRSIDLPGRFAAHHSRTPRRLAIDLFWPGNPYAVLTIHIDPQRIADVLDPPGFLFPGRSASRKQFNFIRYKLRVLVDNSLLCK